MKIRNVEQLYDRIEAEFMWRNKELVFFEKNIQAKKRPAHLRSGVVMLYAHWEGFIKRSAEYYLTFVANQKLRYDELSSCFTAFALKKKIEIFQSSDKASIHTKFVRFIRNNFSQRADMPYRYNISTQSNLNAERLKEILIMIGIDFSNYASKNELIDEKLLAERNTVAHGQQFCPDYKETILLYQDVMAMLSQIKNDILNAAVMEAYKRGTEHEEDEKEALS